MSEANNVTLTIDNRTITVPAGTLVVDAAKMAGIDIPVFCYHPKMEPVGMCRMCLVEVGRPQIDRETREPVLDENGEPVIQFGANLDTGCTVQVSEGMVVRGYTEKVEAGRNEVLEFILTSHPLDCPICDKGGECPLQNLTMAHGPGTSRFLLDDKIQLAKHVPLGELIYLDRERCIQCARCTRFQDEVVDDPVIGFYNRGRRLEIMTHSEPGFDSYWSGNTTDICPVGALTTADFRFGARPWELNSAASICNQCPVGCNLTFNTRREAKTGGGFRIKRVMPRQNESVNEIWMCDKGRFSSYHFTESEDVLTDPMIRVDGALRTATWGEALDHAAEKLGAAMDAGGVLSLVSGRLSNEDLFNVRQLSDHLGGTAALHTHLAGGDVVAAQGLGPNANLGDLGAGDAVLVVACDLEEEAPVWWLRVKQAAERGAALVVANPRPTKLDASASRSMRYAYGEELSVLDRLPEAVTDAENLVIFYGGEGLGLAGSAELAEALGGLVSGKVGQGCSGLVAVHGRPNDQGAWELGFRPQTDLAGAFAAAGAVYVAGADPVGDLGIEKGETFLVVQDVLLTETARAADVVLPAAPFTARDGSYTSGERRVQRFYTAVPGPGDIRPDFTITAQLAMRLDLEIEGRHVIRVFNALSGAVEAFNGLTFAGLAEVEEQWPIVGREDMYYGGTTYENYQGMGRKLAPVDPGEIWKAPAGAAPALSGGLAAVPVTVLYDHGTVIGKSNTLAPRLTAPHFAIHPSDAAELGLAEGARATVRANGRAAVLPARLDGNVPQGTLLVPRSMGLDLDGPSGVEVELKEMEPA